jgi:hypothetical protein
MSLYSSYSNPFFYSQTGDSSAIKPAIALAAPSSFELPSQSLTTFLNESSFASTSFIDPPGSPTRSTLKLPSIVKSNANVPSSSSKQQNQLFTQSIDKTFSIASAVTEATEEEDWAMQLKILEEADNFKKKAAELIPSDLKTELLSNIEYYPEIRRMPIYKLMEYYDYNHELLSMLLSIFFSCPKDVILPMIDFLHTLINDQLHKLGLKFFYKIQSQAELLRQFFTSISLIEGQYLIQVASHLPEYEFQFMADCLLGVGSVNDMLEAFNHHDTYRVSAKHCGLCRQKRMINLHTRMCQDQVPIGMTPVPGTIPLYDKAEIWAADDERHYTFDSSLGEIYWEKYPVNLVEICDKCLMEVHKAITNYKR